MAERNEQEVIIEAWNTVLFDKFSRFEHLLTQGLSSHSAEALLRHPPAPGANVLDLGCGFGDTTRQLATLAGPGGHATGVDCAENFIQRCRLDAERAGLANASFFVADVQTADLGGPYDRAFSRFGTMFFSLPGAALRNVRRALRPGGALTMIVWRKREDNPWLHEAELKVRSIVPETPRDESNQVHCGPGPFSMAGPDLVSDLLRSAGYERIGFERNDTDICIGRNLDEAVEFAMALGPAGELIRLAAEEGEKRKPEIVAGLRETLARFVRDGALWAPSSTWFVSARNPA